jgi:hypothetical protein
MPSSRCTPLQRTSSIRHCGREMDGDDNRCTRQRVEAAEGVASSCRGRANSDRAPPDSAASCNRRVCESFNPPPSATTTAAAGLRKHRSIAHRRSSSVGGSTSSERESRFTTEARRRGGGDFGFWILDFGLRSEACCHFAVTFAPLRNPKSQIPNPKSFSVSLWFNMCGCGHMRWPIHTSHFPCALSGTDSFEGATACPGKASRGGCRKAVGSAFPRSHGLPTTPPVGVVVGQAVAPNSFCSCIACRAKCAKISSGAVQFWPRGTCGPNHSCSTPRASDGAGGPQPVTTHNDAPPAPPPPPEVMCLRSTASIPARSSSSDCTRTVWLCGTPSMPGWYGIC